MRSARTPCHERRKDERFTPPDGEPLPVQRLLHGANCDDLGRLRVLISFPWGVLLCPLTPIASRF